MQNILSGSISLPKNGWSDLGSKLRYRGPAVLVNTTITFSTISLGKMEAISVRTYRNVAPMRDRRPLIIRQTQLRYSSSLSVSMILRTFRSSSSIPREPPNPGVSITPMLRPHSSTLYNFTPLVLLSILLANPFSSSISLKLRNCAAPFAKPSSCIKLQL